MEVVTRYVMALALAGGCTQAPLGKHEDPPGRPWGGVLVSVGDLRIAVHPHWYAYTNLGGNEASLCIGFHARDGKPHEVRLHEVKLLSSAGELLASKGDPTPIALGSEVVTRLFQCGPDPRLPYREGVTGVRILGSIDGQAIDEEISLPKGAR